VKYYQLVAPLALAGVFAAMGSASTGAAKTAGQIDSAALESACVTAAASEPSALRGSGKTTKMWCAVVDREGVSLAINATDTGGTPRSPNGSDAWRGSIEIALAKAYTAVAFSSNDQPLDSFTVGLLTRPDGGGLGPVGHDSGPAPLWGLGNSNPYRPLIGTGNKDDSTGRSHHGIITFAGGQPVYTQGSSGCGGGTLIGAVGVSGDGVDEDDAVAKATVTGAGYCLHP
jgi:uncharacterized protein GlcG (DUF336 family)